MGYKESQERYEQRNRENDLRRHRTALEDQARRQTELMGEANRLAEKQATAGSGGASTGGDPVVAMVVLLVLAVVAAIIAIVVTYWAEILFAGLAVLAFHYRKPISRLVRRVAAACSETQAEAVELPPLEESVTAAQLCGTCRKPNILPAPFCRHCGCRIAPPPAPAVTPPSLGGASSTVKKSPPPPTGPRIEQPAITQCREGVFTITEINGWRRQPSEHQMITVGGQRYRICGHQVDSSHPDWVHYAIQGKDSRIYGVSVRNDGFQSGLIDLVVEDAPITSTAEPIKPGTRLNIPARCGCTGQTFVYLCRYQANGQWFITGTDVSQAVSHDAAAIPMTDVQGSFINATDFAGCPYCTADSFFVCNDCETVSCDGSARDQYEEYGDDDDEAYEDEEENDDERQYQCGGCGIWRCTTCVEVLDVRGQEQQVSERRDLMLAHTSRRISVAVHRHH